MTQQPTQMSNNRSYPLDKNYCYLLLMILSDSEIFGGEDSQFFITDLNSMNMRYDLYSSISNIFISSNGF